MSQLAQHLLMFLLNLRNAFLLSASFLFIGCAPVPEPVLPSNESSAHAVLDWENLSFRLPLDQYGMSNQDEQIVTAAQEIVFARCVTGSKEIGSEALSIARQRLSNPPESVNPWLYGFWNAPYIAAHGYDLTENIAATYEYEPEKGMECANSAAFQDLAAVNRTDLGQSDKTKMFMEYTFNAGIKTKSDQRFIDLKNTRDSCITKMGYATNQDSDLGGVKAVDSWSSEEYLKAIITEAKCADSMEFTQRVADINSEYEEEYISKNQAELVAIKKIAVERVSSAKAILREFGIE